MKKIYISLLSFASLGLVNNAFAVDVPQAQVPVASPQASASNFTAAQLGEIEKTVADYLTKHPDVVMAAFQAGMAAQQKETVVKMEKAVAEHKDKIFKDSKTPIAGNLKGSKSLVVFMDPYCGYCKKFHGELATFLTTNKDVKILYKDIPIMGKDSTLAIKAMLAAKEQGKYDQLQKAVFSSDKHLKRKDLLKLASSVGIDTKKLEADMKDKGIQAQIDQNLELSKALGINGTPTLIVGETKVLPGYVSAEELAKLLKETSASAENKAANPKSS